MASHPEGLTRGSSSSTDVSPADVAIPPPAILLSAHPPAKTLLETEQEERTNYSLIFPKTRIAKYADARKLPGRHAKINPGDRAVRIKIAERCGDMITADQKVLNEEQESRLHQRYAVVVQDLASQWIQSYPCKKSAQETQRSLGTFLHPEEHRRSSFTDNSLESI